jgi:hypothetical protein
MGSVADVYALFTMSTKLDCLFTSTVNSLVLGIAKVKAISPKYVTKVLTVAERFKFALTGKFD